jgi:mono/diheme cytochrome c family protein
MRFIFLLTLSFSVVCAKSQAINKQMMSTGKDVFSLYCLACHQEDGTGVPNLNPPLVKTSYVLGDKKKLIGIVLNGFEEKVEINGEFYSNVMAPHDFLSDIEVASVLTYVRNSFGNKASAITVAEVKNVRKAINK